MDPVAVTLSLALFVVVIAALMAGFPVAFTLAGVSLGFGLLASVFGLFDLSLFGALPQRIFAVMQSEILVAVPLFVFMGVVLERSRVAENLLNAVTSTLGSTRGGLGIAVCLVGALMAASTGIVGATVVTMGLISLPAMLKAGYRPSFAAGTIAASGTLGQIIPPSIVLIILGDQLAGAYSQAQYRLGNFAPDAVSVNDLFAGALIPGLLLVSLYIVWILLRTWLNPDVAPPLNQRAHDQHPHAPNLMRSLIAPLSLIVAVLGSILGGLASPTEAASIGAVGAAAMIAMLLSTWAEGPVVLKLIAAALTAVGIICALVWMAVSTEDDGQVSLLTSSMRQTLRMTSMIFLVLIGASVFSLVFRGVGGDDVIERRTDRGACFADDGGQSWCDHEPRVAGGTHRRQSPDIVSDTALWLCAFLSAGRCARLREDIIYLHRHPAVCGYSAAGAGANLVVSGSRHLAAGSLDDRN